MDKNSAIQETPHTASSKIMERLNNVMENTSPLDRNRSADLIPLTTEFEQMKHELRGLLAAVKTYKMKTVAMNDAKFEVSNFKQIAG
jgi:hypothetical protein